MPELKPGDYVRLDSNGRLVRCEPTDFAYGVVVMMSTAEPDCAVVVPLGQDSRQANRLHQVASVVPDLNDLDLVEEWLDA